MSWRVLAQNLHLATWSLAEHVQKSRVMNPRRLQWLCAGGTTMALIALVAVVPIWGQSNAALVDGLSRRVETLELRTQAHAVDMASVHGQIMVLQDQIAVGLRVIERVFWATIAILGSIFYRGVAAIWSLRKGWIVPTDTPELAWNGQDRRQPLPTKKPHP